MTKKGMFKIFQEEAVYWQAFFTLTEWCLFFEYKHLKNIFAEVWMNWEGMAATLVLNRAQTGKTELQVRRSAFHEICHLLIAEIASYNYHKDVEEFSHKLIRKLENTIFNYNIKERLPYLFN